MKNTLLLSQGEPSYLIAQQWTASRLHFRSRMLGYDIGFSTPDSKVLIVGFQGFGKELAIFEIWED